MLSSFKKRTSATTRRKLPLLYHTISGNVDIILEELSRNNAQMLSTLGELSDATRQRDVSRAWVAKLKAALAVLQEN